MEFRHQTITALLVTPEKFILHGLTTLTDTLTGAPTAQLDAQHQAIAALSNASNSWAAPNEKSDPAVPILSPTPAQTRRSMKILDRKLKQPPLTRQPNPRVPNEPALCETSPRRKIQQHLTAPSPMVRPKETPPVV